MSLEYARKRVDSRDLFLSFFTVTVSILGKDLGKGESRERNIESAIANHTMAVAVKTAIAAIKRDCIGM